MKLCVLLLCSVEKKMESWLSVSFCGLCKLFQRLLYVCSNYFVSKCADNIQTIDFPKMRTNNTIKRMMLGDDYTTKLALNGIFYFVS